MSAISIAEGDTVVHEVIIGANLPPKQHRGVVVDTGRKGCQVKFEGKLGVRWMPVGMLTVVDRAKPDKPAKVETPKPAKPPPDFVPKPVPPPSEAMASVEAWKSMGRELLDGVREAVHFAEVAVRAAQDGEAEARRDREKAEAELERVRGELRHLEKVVSA